MTLALAGALGTDPSALVGRLGAPKYADREAASASLEKLGPEAIPALRSARTAKDAEVRTRAVVLLDRIESELLVRPTMVNLNFRDRPLSEIVTAIGERGHASLALHPREGPETRGRRLTLVRPEAVPFWTAVEALDEAAGLELVGGSPMVGLGQGGGQLTVFNLFSRNAGLRPVPSVVSGPFRVSLLGLTYHKERNFGGGNNNGGMIVFPGGMMPNGQIVVPADAMGGQGVDQFFANLQVLAEPRMNVALNGPARVSEATDENGQSLLTPTSPGSTFQHQSGYNRFEPAGGIAIQTTIPLKYPDRPGRRIKSLRGVVPVTVSARKDDPMVIPLADAKGKTYHNSEISLTIHEVKTDGNNAQTSIDLSVRSMDSTANGGLLSQEFTALRQPNSPQQPLEIATHGVSSTSNGISSAR